MTTPNATQNLLPGLTYTNVRQCALVLEDNPVNGDSRLEFESFPEDGIEESYSVNGYREIAGGRMPQPGFAAYRGGNWSSFTLVLKFRAGGQAPTRKATLSAITESDLEGILIEMQRKARWCQALCFPLERQATSLTNRIQRRARTGGISESALQQAGLGQLTRNDPPLVLVVFGSFLTLRCYCTGYAIKWEHPFHPATAHPYGAEVSLQFQRLELEYPTWETIRNQAGRQPQAPNLPRIGGDVVFRSEAARRQEQAIAAANASAIDVARAGGEAAAALSSGGLF